MTWEQEIKRRERIVREEALAQGISQGRIETAKKMFKKHYEPSDIAECTGLSLDQVMALQKEVCVTVC